MLRPQGSTPIEAVEPQVSSPVERLGDRVLAAAAASGDSDAFEVLVRRHGAALYRYTRRMLADPDAVDDIIQDTFIAAWRRIGAFRGDASLRTWLFAICARKVVDSRRVKTAQPIDDRLLEPLSTSAAADPLIRTINAEFLAALEEALAELPVRQRAAWLLREIEALTFQQIGVILNLTPDAARGHHHRAQVTLRQRMQRWR